MLTNILWDQGKCQRCSWAGSLSWHGSRVGHVPSVIHTVEQRRDTINDKRSKNTLSHSSCCLSAQVSWSSLRFLRGSSASKGSTVTDSWPWIKEDGSTPPWVFTLLTHSAGCAGSAHVVLKGWLKGCCPVMQLKCLSTCLISCDDELLYVQVMAPRWSLHSHSKLDAGQKSHPQKVHPPVWSPQTPEKRNISGFLAAKFWGNCTWILLL